MNEKYLSSSSQKRKRKKTKAECKHITDIIIIRVFTSFPPRSRADLDLFLRGSCYALCATRRTLHFAASASWPVRFASLSLPHSYVLQMYIHLSGIYALYTDMQPRYDRAGAEGPRADMVFFLRKIPKRKNERKRGMPRKAKHGATSASGIFIFELALRRYTAAA